MNYKKTFKSITKVILLLFIALLIALLMLFFAIQHPKFQTFLTQKVTQSLSKELNMPLQVKEVDISFFNNVKVEDVYAQDFKGDTLLYLNSLDANFSYFSLFQKKITLKDITLNELYINLERAYDDSLFNFNYITINTTGKSKEKNTTQSPWDIVFRNVLAKKVHFVMDDAYGGMFINAKVDSLHTDFDILKLGNDLIILEELKLIKPDVLITLTKANPTKKPKQNLSTFYLPLNINSKRISLKNGTINFINKRDTSSVLKTKFNKNDIRLDDIQLFAQDFKLNKDNLYLNLKEFSTKEHNEFAIIQMNSEIQFNNNTLKLDNFYFRSALSTIEANASLNYDSLADFKQFITNVNIDFDLNPSSIHPKDIAYFVNTSQFDLKYPIQVSGEIYGSVKSFNSKKLSLRTANNVLFNGEFSMNGLPNIKESFISGKVTRFHIDYNDLELLFPELKLPKNLSTLGLVKFKGNFDGFTTDFVMNGDFTTAIGRANTDLNFKLTDNNIPKYSGIINLNQFDLGKFFGNEVLFGQVSMNVKGDGKGINLNNLDAQLDGEIEEIDFKGYSYKNVMINGRVLDRFFEGALSIDDENLGVDFNGVVNAKEKILDFKFDADIAHINPKALNLWKNDMTFAGSVTSDFRASSINDLVGDLSIKDLKISKAEKEYEVSTISLKSRMLVNGEKYIEFLADDVQAIIQGNFEIEKIPSAFKSVLLTNYKKPVDNQLIKFDVNVNENPALLELLNSDIKILANSTIGGNLNSNTNSLLARINVPVFKMKNISAIDFNSNIYINNGDYDIINALPSIYLNDSLIIENVSFLIKGPRNYLDLKLYADGIKDTSVELLAKMITKNKRIKLAFEPSNIFINKQFWLIDEDNEINISEKIESRNLKIYNGLSEIFINLDIGIEQQKADVLLNNILVEDFTQFLEAKNIKLKGVVNGKAGMDMSTENPSFFGNVLVENIKVNDYEIGNLNSRATLDLPNQKVLLNGSLYGNDNEVNINGSYSFAKKSTNKDFAINFDIKHLAVYTVEDFIQDYIDNSKGTVTGKLKLVGPRKKPDLLGYVDVNDVTTTVSYLQTIYNIKNHRVEFNKKGIYLGDNIRVTDVDGNEAFGSGWVLHNHLKDFALDIDVVTQKLQGINTTIKDNQDFYGTAYLKGNVKFYGPTNDLKIDIRGESEPKSFIAIPLEDASKTKSYEFFTFVEKDTSEVKEFLDKKIKKLKVNGLTVGLDLDIDSDCELSIILDQSAGDVLEVVGDGNIKIQVPKEGDVEFYGTYTINDGDYLFTLQSVVNKKFRIEPNSSLQFQGKIEETTVNVDAVYPLRAAPQPLIEDYLQTELDEQIVSESKNRVPVKLLLKLSDNLYSPTIKFDIEISQINPSLRNFIDRKIVTLKQYENEMNRQVFGLLVLNQFLPPLNSLDQITNGFNVNVNNAANTVSEFLSNQISRYLNDWLSNFSDNVSFNLNYRNYEQDLSSPTTAVDLALRRELQLALTTRFFNDRVTLNLGGNVDFGQNQLGPDNTNTTFFGGNASVEYALTKNRRFRIKAFTITDYDYFNQNNTTRAGVGLSFKREFNKFKDLKISKDEFKFNKDKKEVKEDNN